MLLANVLLLIDFIGIIDNKIKTFKEKSFGVKKQTSEIVKYTKLNELQLDKTLKD